LEGLKVDKLLVLGLLSNIFMNVNKLFKVFLLFIFLQLTSCKEPGPERIVHLDFPEMSKVSSILLDDGDSITMKTENFLIENFRSHYSDFNEFALERLCETSGNNPEITDWSIYLYKESRKTTYENIKRNRKLLYQYSENHDLILVYSWKKRSNVLHKHMGHYKGKAKFELSELVCGTDL